MANIFTMAMDGITARVAKWAYGSSGREEGLEKNQRYYKGQQDKQLKVIKGYDDNLIENYVALIVDRGVSMLMGHGVDFYPPDERSKEWLDLCWEANKKDISLLNMAKAGGIFGTPFVKIQPEGVAYKGALYPRIIVQNPKYWQIFTAPEDIETVIKYRMEFNSTENGKEVTRREDFDLEESKWLLREYVDRGTGQFILLEEQVIPYDFPLVHHWQNLPVFDSVYGEPDVTPAVLDQQDKYNYVQINNIKLQRLHAHPKTFGTGIGNGKQISIGPDDLPLLPEGADLKQLTPSIDMAAGVALATSIRQAMFDITRTPDITSMADKLGALTNFGLHVLYQDAMSKLETKRELYGEALEIINQRLAEYRWIAEMTRAKLSLGIHYPPTWLRM